MEDIKIYTVKEAEAIGLMQLKIWVNKKEFPWILSEYKRLSKDKNRTVMIVQNYSQFTLYVNELASVNNLNDMEVL